MSRRANRTPNEEADAGLGEAFELEQQNNRHLDSLAAKVTALHSVSLNIHDDVNDQNRLLDGTSETFNRFGNMFDRTRYQLTHTLTTANSKFLCYLTLILVLGVFGLYYIARNILTREGDPSELL
ncbi:BET1-like protein [Kickxella alabastrina]|uniref:BET1-like protein n=1 Tax=Kickxella alabastrina TaxID=61397 RepID=A0ACC1IAJ1_9FUNG|nr:BET1-like protein [Kickxella alabastrina]